MTKEKKLGICKDCKNRCGQMCVENVSTKGEVIHCSQYKPLKNSRADLAIDKPVYAIHLADVKECEK